MTYYWKDFDGDEFKRWRDSLEQSRRDQQLRVEVLRKETEAAETKARETEQKVRETEQKTKEVEQKSKEEANQQTKVVSEQEKAAVQKEVDIAKKQEAESHQEAVIAKEKALETEQKLKEAEQELKKTEQVKREVSQSLGENYGHRYCTESLGYQEVLHGDSKTIKQGFDSVYYDPKTKETVVVEFKGQNSQLSPDQQKIEWTPEVCNKILQEKGIYQRASEPEWNTAKQVQDAYSRSELRYEVVRTEIDREGNLATQKEQVRRPEEPKEARQEPEKSYMQPKNETEYKAFERFYSSSNQRNENQNESRTESYESKRG